MGMHDTILNLTEVALRYFEQDLGNREDMRTYVNNLCRELGVNTTLSCEWSKVRAEGHQFTLARAMSIADTFFRQLAKEYRWFRRIKIEQWQNKRDNRPLDSLRLARKCVVRVFDSARGECGHILPELFPWESSLPWAPTTLSESTVRRPDGADGDAADSFDEWVGLNRFKSQDVDRIYRIGESLRAVNCACWRRYRPLPACDPEDKRYSRSTQVSRQSPKTPRFEHVLWAGNELSRNSGISTNQSREVPRVSPVGRARVIHIADRIGEEIGRGIVH